MYFNFFAGLILPCLFGIYIYRKAPVILLTAYIFTALLSVSFNQLGMQSGLWKVVPKPEVILFESLFLDLGYFAVFGAFFTYFLYFKKWKRVYVYGAILLLMNGFELIALYMEKVLYSAPWNVYYTFFTYLACMITVDSYGYVLKKLRVYPY
ncbi:hypothetical protein [Thalassobacillus pellis]|uniref:hypothetical protein n=1 Tax=Thalassobacillus pellis TaxID=748008 RepID=UPI00196225CF|nr:hypothetical protein [Thalassobacillus pellis]MBM7551317.1 hypothetical protein [Thalassobacillus pellis]